MIVETVALPTTDLMLRLGAATLLGGLVGLERERLDRAAGLRTHALVAVASALMMVVSAYGFAGAVTPDRAASLDPSRLAAQVVSGIGFLGAGVIIFQKNRVRGLTTAASIWSVAGVGLAAGGGLFLAAGLGTLFILLIQAGLRPVERHFFAHHQEHRLALRIGDDVDGVPAVERIMGAAGIAIRRLRLRSGENGKGGYQLDLDLGAARQEAIATVLARLRAAEGVRIVSYSREPASILRGDDGDDGDDAPGIDRGQGIGSFPRRPLWRSRRGSAFTRHRHPH